MTTRSVRRIMATGALLLAPLSLMVSCGGNATKPAVTETFNSPPAVVMSGVTNAAVSGPVTVVFTFSQPVSTFPALAVVVTNGTKAASTTQLSTNQYSLVVTPPANATGTMTINVAAGAFTSAAGVANTAPATVTQAYNTVVAPPAVTLPVFVDAYASGATFSDFGGATNAISADAATPYNGHASLKAVIPASNYTGGSIVSATAKDLSSFNALTFWAKASAAANLDVAGLGNDATATGANLAAESHTLVLTTTWTKYIVPIPVPAKATSVKGLFHFAQGANAGVPTYWFADIQYETLATVPVVSGATTSWPSPTLQIGATSQMVPGPNTVNFSVPTLPLGGLFNVGWGYFTLTPSAPTVATVDATGLITAVAAGTCNLTGKLGTLDVPGQAVVTVAAAAFGTPTTLPPVPAPPSGATVISLWSSVTGGFNGSASDKSANVQTWLTSWSGGTGGSTFPLTVGANTAAPRLWTMGASTNFIGFELVPDNNSPTIDTTHEIDISGMTHMHVDLWTPDDSTNLQIKLVDGGADGQINPGYNGIALFTPTATPPLATNAWLSYDLPIDATTGFPGNNFPGGNASSLKHLAQFVIIAPSGGHVYLDNLYFYGAGSGGGTATAPTSGAPAPSLAQSAVISLYNSSNHFSNITVGNWNPNWGQGGSIADAVVGSATVKLLDLVNYQGINISGPDGAPADPGAIDITGKNTLHLSYWTANGTKFNLSPINMAGEYPIDSGTLVQGAWTDLEIPINQSGFALTGIRQLKFETLTGPEKIYLDNIYFH